MEPSKHATNEPRIPSVEPNNTEASSSSAASQTSAPPTAHSVCEATSSSDTSPVESRPPSKRESATADPAPPCPQFNPEDWSAPIAHTYTGTTVLSFPDDMHTVTSQGARFLTHIYTCPVGDLDWDKAIANMLQWCSFEQHRRAPSSQGHPPPIHGLLKCAPIIQANSSATNRPGNPSSTSRTTSANSRSFITGSSRTRSPMTRWRMCRTSRGCLSSSTRPRSGGGI
ncbi:uncharacterized protein BO72DRAFT_452958 [Aspergillus fijiensis CBS 313.89]|uniref:Uncharacterized protein n=1 Tax=Aspergillus fijiensis CBS 313.89 TaxID=1448319 RepID=A0A8G1VTB1_9EURO|nr:uncharacterized protein BO72DRAFT_452958 [Aspergillus fijiensis CBS 313.89]RAK72135.1 hypothetical protein BO72DRAFT_452958 [Aspergillus fijiensis CBS 313.89]